MRELNPSVEFANKTGLVYSAVCKPLCQKLHPCRRQRLIS